MSSHVGARFSDLQVKLISDMCMAAPPMCRSAQNDVCCHFQPCTSAQTNPTDSRPNPSPNPNPLGGARGRQWSPAMHTSLMNFTGTSEKPCTHVRLYVWWSFFQCV